MRDTDRTRAGDHESKRQPARRTWLQVAEEGNAEQERHSDDAAGHASRLLQERLVDDRAEQ